ncbi:hypothetical protein QYF36_016316 [Acer negundo]|nr:hypothetical protein QYF36_016316 [Acer negundo]
MEFRQEEVHHHHQSANYVPLTPINFLERAATLYGNKTAIVYGSLTYSWKQTHQICLRIASALAGHLHVSRGDIVAAMAPNIPALYKLHFAVPMAGAVLSALNTKLDADSLASILEQLEAKIMFVDYQFVELVFKALDILSKRNSKPPLLVIIPDQSSSTDQPYNISSIANKLPSSGILDYNVVLEMGKSSDFEIVQPENENDPISVNYTSGSTGDPKGVVYSHRGAYLNSLAQISRFEMREMAVFLWTVDMFRCNGWCCTWAMAALGGTNICLREVSAGLIFDSIRVHQVTHFCGPPTLLNIIANASDPETHDQQRRPFQTNVNVLVAGVLPEAQVVEKVAKIGFNIGHAYGMTEVLGPAIVRPWKLLECCNNPGKINEGLHSVLIDGLCVLHSDFCLATEDTFRPIINNMTVTWFTGGPSCGFITGKHFGRRAIKNLQTPIENRSACGRCYFGVINRRELISNNVIKCCGSISSQHTSDYIEINPSGVGESESEETSIAGQSRSQNVQTELIMLSLPAIAGQAIEPLAQLMETAYVGRLGVLELASAGVSISIFNIISKVFNIPLLSIATSFVAEDISRNAGEESTSDSRKATYNGSYESTDRKLLPSVSTALILAGAIGILEALAMYFGSGLFLDIMGISSASSMRIQAQRFLSLRSIGAPAVVLSLAIQGIFRGFKDTRTPVICLGMGNFAAVFMFPILMYYFQLGVTGAAISTIASQYIVTFLMIWHLNKRTVLSLPSMKNLHFGNYLRSGGFLLGRTLAAVMTITLSTAMAARQGPLAMAGHQIWLQVWLSVSLLADAQAASGQALIASSFAQGDYKTVKEITHCSLKNGLFTGISLAAILGASFGYIATLFTKDVEVLRFATSGLLFISVSQPITALAYIFDGLHYGISDFSYAAYSMMTVGAISCASLLYAPNVYGLSGVWFGLTLFMGLRVVAGYIRLSSKSGPWWFLQKDMPKLEIAI